jgi:hypothetical protein
MHPIRDDIQPAVLQYRDDTLIIAKASHSATAHLKQTLESFASATGLQINFDKTTFVPMHVSEELATYISSQLGTPTFPNKTSPICIRRTPG